MPQITNNPLNFASEEKYLIVVTGEVMGVQEVRKREALELTDLKNVTMCWVALQYGAVPGQINCHLLFCVIEESFDQRLHDTCSRSHGLLPDLFGMSPIISRDC